MDVTSPLGPLFAFWAGLVSILSPCVLPLIPVYITHLTGQTTQAMSMAGAGGPSTATFSIRNNAAFPHAVAFVLGFSVVFVIMGASVGVVGYALQDRQDILERIAGVLIIAMGLHVSGILKIPFLERTYEVDVGRDTPPGLTRSFLVGSAFSVGWTPCFGPILGTILGLAATSSTVWQGAILLVFYSVGFSIPFLLTGAAVGTATRALRAVRPYMGAVSAVSGVVLIVAGILIFTGELASLNQYFDFFESDVTV
ncbi:MAG TPA: cytochrome c biogenesis protein CcdA [Dehalococcoidia bacterium]|nr:cytochrome c biogenesis protein CcdA [Dehalococcoidia bacterium]